MTEPGDIFAGVQMTLAELVKLDQLMLEAQRTGSTVWPATFWSGPLNEDITGVRRDVNAVFPWGA
jgi:hypothetical protein